jgi:protein-S-isoprenylcysteine O-methyltransferase Ste14
MTPNWIEPIARFVPLVSVVMLLLIGVVWRSWLQRKRYGTWGIVHVGLVEPVQAVTVGSLVLAFVLLGGEAFAAALRPADVHLLVRLSPHSALIASTLGATILAGGFALLVAAQLAMGSSWRIGIDHRSMPGLVDTGPFRLCRNPIYLALLVIIAGYLALLPTWTSVLVWAGTYLGVRLQIGAEETYLQRIYGEAYHVYAQRVGRLLPGIGRHR